MRELSLRLRIPLSLAGTVLFTTLVLGAVIAWQTWENLADDLEAYGRKLAMVLEPGLAGALKHDDVWRVYTLLSGPSDEQGRDRGILYAVFDPQGRVFAASRPRELAVGVPVERLPKPLSALAEVVGRGPPRQAQAWQALIPGHLVLASPITLDGFPVGTLVQVYPRSLAWARFWQIIERALLSIFVLLALILPLGWYWGKRMADPVVDLARCMDRLEREPLESVRCELPAATGRDEIGQLAERFRSMVQALQQKADLERRMVASERLAAVGRLAAGVAHEVNNPLGGMLVALDTLRRRGPLDPATARTVALLERGLTQIRESVAALLVEARPQSHPFSAEDVEDVRTLVVAQSEMNRVKLQWESRLEGAVALPSTPVRQIIINLLLNAIQATPSGGCVRARFALEEAVLRIEVANQGEPIEPERMARLFEPYYTSRRDGAGLGLWVTYQIVQQLNGGISIESGEGWNSFRVELPLEADSHAGNITQAVSGRG